MKYSNKLKNLPPYIFAQLDSLIAEKKQAGQEIYVLSKSDPDRPTDNLVVQALQEKAELANNHHYPDFDGLLELRQSVSEWYATHYGVSLDSNSEILPLMGSKEGIVHFCQAWLDHGDIALLPDPAFPSYKTGTILAGGEPYFMPLRAPQFTPAFEDIPVDIAKKAKLMFLNYPNNPTGVTVTKEFWEEVLAFAREYDIIVASDHAYSMTCFQPEAAPSIFTVDKNKENSIEFFTFSKAFHMAGWRLGIAVGNSEVIRGLKVIETHVNAGIFNPIQYAGAQAFKLGLNQGFFDEDNRAYKERLTLLVEFFNSMGWKLEVPKGTVYLWVPAPAGMNGEGFSKFLLDNARVVVSPGIAFGEEGRMYVRLCVTYQTEVIEKAIQAISDVFREHNIQGPGTV
ncbi:MAG: aminotransferase class I/II-fold pyridoxal phosphate-dependent enzyme [Desulfitobacterium hafniense]|nr:aminotransferase class I/II-fold pyridoxal phosphate-dependent enzyme [Desulfitobacterium hafniense]